MKLALFSLCLVAVTALLPFTARAGDCFEDPEYTRDWSATVTTSAYVRDVACMDGSVVVTTAPLGATVAVIAETDGWYKIRTTAGVEGWVGAWLLSVTETPYTQTTTTTTVAPSPELINRLRGYILLQTQEHGEAWYVHPVESKRYYMQDGPTAYEMMRAFGLGISEADFTLLQSGDAALIKRLKGYIVLRVGLHGEAYYIHPVDGSVNYLADGEAAYQIMRELSLGITNADLAQITLDVFVPVPYVLGATSVAEEEAGIVPSQVSVADLRGYWKVLVNNFRKDRGLPVYASSDALDAAATSWSTHLAATGTFTHTRSGQSLYSWAQEQVPGLQEQFAENLAYDYILNSSTSARAALDEAFLSMVAEESWQGGHFLNIVDQTMDHQGVGFAFIPQDNGTYKIIITAQQAALIE